MIRAPRTYLPQLTAYLLDGKVEAANERDRDGRREAAGLEVLARAVVIAGAGPPARQGGCEAYVSNPISVPKFIETIKTYLGDA